LPLQRFSRREIVDIFSADEFLRNIPQVHLGLHAALEMFWPQLNALYILSERRKQGFGGETWRKEVIWETQA